MRFAELQLLRYGRFEDCHLVFPRVPTDLHIIYGPNEAGKSTTMCAVSDLLFGFPHISPYDFRFDNRLLRVGAVIEGEGSKLICVRKKGRSGTLMDAAERVIDEGALAARLAGYSSDSFQRMFSLDHGRLREGGRAILAASDDVGQAIFAAGSGLIGVTSVLANLEEEAKAIWTKRAGDRRYYVAQKAFDEARALQRAAQIKPAAWEELNKQIKKFDIDIAELERLRGEANLERERVERRRRVLPHVVLYQDAQSELAALGDVLEFPADASTILDQVAQAVAAAKIEARLASDECKRLRDELALIIIDRRLIEYSADIAALPETKGAVEKGLKDIARKRVEVRTLMANLATHQRELKWPLEDAERAKDRLPQRVSVAEVRDLLEKRNGLDATLNAAIEAETTARQNVKVLEKAIAALPPERDLNDLSAAVRFARGLGDVEVALGSAEREVERRRKGLATDLAKLLPWTGDTDALRGLLLPSDAETTAAATKTASVEKELDEAKREHQAAVKRREQLLLLRDQLMREDHAVPSTAVEDARASRDAVWGQVRAHLLEEELLSEPRLIADDFEQRGSIADAVADQRFAYAEQSARLAALQDEIERNELAIEQAAAAVGSAERAVETCAADWQTLLDSSGLRITPTAFSAWSERRGRALESAQSLDVAKERLLSARTGLDAGHDRLLEAVQCIQDSVDVELSFGRLLEMAERLETNGAAEAVERRRLGDALDAAKLSLTRAEEKVAKAEEALLSWDQDWERAVRAAALSAGVSQAVVRAQLELIDAVRGLVQDILDLEQRIRDMDQDATDFNESVLALAIACGLETQGRSSAELVDNLTKAFGEAMRLDARLSDLQIQLADAEKRLADGESDEAKALARLEPLTLIAETSDPTELAAAVQVCERARTLKRELARHAEEIIKAGAGPKLETLIAECENADPEALVLRSQELTDEVTRLSSEVAQLSADRATAKAEFRRLDAGPDAAIAAADAEQAKAEMAVQAEAYVRKRAEIALLKWAIAKYRSEKQNPLLKRASAIFSRLTLGRYVELLVDLESDRARLAGLTDDQAVVPVEGMSEGTVDQLFLSLRLAAVEEAVDNGSHLPFLADDLFINYDDARSAAGFQVLAELARKTQVLFFTHHQHLLDLAREALSPTEVPRLTLV